MTCLIKDVSSSVYSMWIKENSQVSKLFLSFFSMYCSLYVGDYQGFFFFFPKSINCPGGMAQLVCLSEVELSGSVSRCIFSPFTTPYVDVYTHY